MKRKFGDDLAKKNVVTQDGRALGSVKDIEVDSDNWKISGLYVSVKRGLAKELSIKNPVIGSATIHIPSEEISGVSDNLVLKLSMQDLSDGKSRLRVVPAKSKPSDSVAQGA